MSCFFPISYDFSVISKGLTFEKAWSFIVYSYQQFWLRNRPGLAALFGIQMASFFGIVFSFVIVSLLMFYVCHYLSCFILTKTNKDIGRIHWNCSALPRVFLVIYVFSRLKRILKVFLPSSTPHLSKALHFIQFEVPIQLSTLPHRDLCKTEPHSPDANLPFHLSQQNIIKFQSNSLHTYLA